ncbi:hypothetical protein [uncultured Xylophilus sp.]|uniref:hypothetical protein n=1 Tax=uncultured Xylophilus sp. TaxID=296832 RepID=UPI0025D8361A|nr:hypothetical protein [uncultured Xylophilus sp.]
MTKPQLIALTGFAGTGKDTVADLLVAHCGFRKVAFADALRAEVSEAFGVSLDMLTDRDGKERPSPHMALENAPVAFLGSLLLAGVLPGRGTPTFVEALEQPRSPRQILQWWGTEYRRAGDSSYWTRALVQRMGYYRQEFGTQRFVIPDCRFGNEAETVRRRAGRIWQINRPGIGGQSTTEGQHASATDGSAFAPDLVINNCHDVRHLAQIALAEVWGQDSGLRGLRVEVPA